MWWNGRDTVTKQFESNLLEKHKTSLETKQEARKLLAWWTEAIWHQTASTKATMPLLQKSGDGCLWVNFTSWDQHFEFYSVTGRQWMCDKGYPACTTINQQIIFDKKWSRKLGALNTFVCKMAVKTLRHFGPCGWTVQYFNSKCLYFGSGAKMSGHFRPIRTVPKCLSAELSRLWSVRLSSDWKWFSKTNYALWGSTTNGGSRLLKRGHMTETCKISHCILSSVLTTYSCDISIKWFTAFT